MQFVIGIDTGGTFTDITVVDERGNMVIAKSPTTSDHLTGIVSAIAAAAEALGVSTTDLIASTTKFVYGTTVAINALLQRLSDGQVGLIATRGFADTLYLRRSMREDQYNSQEPFPLPFVRRAHTREVTERIDWAGKVVIPLDEDEARRVIRQLVREKKLVKDRIGAVAVCLIHAYANPAHEGRIAELLHEEFPDILVSLSSDVAPEIREYERMSTTVFNACIGNTTVTHFEALQTELRRRGLKAPILIMHAAGGASGIPEVNARPIITLYSGPAAGLVAARYMSELMNMPNIISVDMGGTSFDVGIVQGGEMIRTMSGKLAGFPIMRDSVEIHSIGAGGGSIAWVDDQGIPKVGPQSAGAVPGPVCYDRGGVEPTVTDADVVLGYLDPDNFLGGKIRLSHEKAYQAIKERFADKIGLSVVEAANGIVQIVQQNMINAMRVLTVERGIDPRDSILMAFGGAGGAHAAAMFQDLGIRKVVVPNNASVLSSFGLVVSNLRHSYSASYRSLIDDLDLEKASSLFADMEHRARRTLESEGMTGERIQIEPSIDMSYIGQLHELNVPVSSTAITPALVEEAKLSFTRKYESMYGMTEHLPIQVVTFRVEGIGLVPQPILKEHPIGTEDASGALKGHRPGFFDEADGFVSTPVYDAACIQAGNQVEGPAIVEYDTTTLVVRPRQRIAWDRWLNAIITQDNKEV